MSHKFVRNRYALSTMSESGPVISWKHTADQFSWPLSLDDKITIFEAKIYGWQLHPAELCANGGVEHSGVNTVPAIPHSGFAVLQILLSYFEMIAKHRDGYAGTGYSGKFFRKGFLWVFPMTVAKDEDIINRFVAFLYKHVRCGLYHGFSVGTQIALSHLTKHPLTLDRKRSIVLINPQLLPAYLKKHFETYIGELRDPNNLDSRRNFEKRFDFEAS